VLINNVVIVLINSVFLFIYCLIIFTFQRQVANVPEYAVHRQVAGVTRIGKLVMMLLYNIVADAHYVCYVVHQNELMNKLTQYATGCWMEDGCRYIE
jgi:hypothetical protein